MYSVFRAFRFAILTVSLFVSIFAQASVVDDLSAEQRSNLLAGKVVTKTEKVSGHPWPRVWLWIYIPATAEESAAVASDFELKPKYMNSVKSAKISNVLDRATWDVDYIINVPVISDEQITLRNHLSTLDAGQSFKIEFNMMHASRTKISEGTNIFENFQEGSVFQVYTFVDPNSSFANLAWGKAFKDSQNALVELRDQVLNEKAQEPGHLKEQISRMKDALGVSF